MEPLSTNELTLREYIDFHVGQIREEFREIKSYKDRMLIELRDKYESERDRRYSEVNVEKEKALKIKEEADKAALGLAREIQSYKDEKANELREQIGSERGMYVTKSELAAAMDKIAATIKPIVEHVASERGKSGGLSSAWAIMVSVFSILFAVASFVWAVTRDTTLGLGK